MGGVEYQVTKVDPTDPHTKGAVYQVHKVSEEIAATLGGKVYRARIIKDPTEPTVAGKVYQIVLIDDPDDPAVKGKVYNAILTGGSEAVVVGPAVSPLSLPDAVADTLEYVKAYGGTEIRTGLPDGYTQLEYITFDGTQVIDTDFTPDNETRIESRCLGTGSNCWFYGASSTNPRVTLFYSDSGTSRWGNQSRSSFGFAANTDYTLIQDKNGLNINGTSYAWSSGTAGDFTCGATLTIGNCNGASGTAYFSGNFYYMKIYDDGVLARDFVPCKNASNVVGLYDRANDVFYTETGLVAGPNAVPTPDYPMNIVTNNGVLKARHQSGLPLGYTLLDYIESNGTQYIDTGVKVTQNNRVEAQYCYHTESSVGTSGRIAGGRYTSGSPRNAFSMGTQNGEAAPTTNMFSQFGTNGVAYAGPRVVIGDWFTAKSSTDGYYVNDTAYQAPIPTDDFETPYTVKLFAFEQSAPGGDPTIGCGVGRCANFKIYTNNVLTMNLVPAKNSEDTIGMYDLVSGQFFTNQGTGDFVAGTAVSDPVEIYTDGTVETIEDTIGNTATAEMLLKVGDYKDEQNINTGAITRRVGVKVLDGSENWDYRSDYNVFSWAGIGMKASSRVTSTHFQYRAYATTEKYGVGFIYYTHLFIKNTDYATLADFKQWLADQYAAGTPVIVVYPLETPTTEVVAGQTLQVQDGDNTLEITQASLSGLELEAQYQAAVSLTIQEVEDANLDNNVTVTIQ